MISLNQGVRSAGSVNPNQRGEGFRSHLALLNHCCSDSTLAARHCVLCDCTPGVNCHEKRGYATLQRGELTLRQCLCLRLRTVAFPKSRKVQMGSRQSYHPTPLLLFWTPLSWWRIHPVCPRLCLCNIIMTHGSPAFVARVISQSSLLDTMGVPRLTTTNSPRREGRPRFWGSWLYSLSSWVASRASGAPLS